MSLQLLAACPRSSAACATRSDSLASFCATDVLVPARSVVHGSNTPTYKTIVITLSPCARTRSQSRHTMIAVPGLHVERVSEQPPKDVIGFTGTRSTRR